MFEDFCHPYVAPLLFFMKLWERWGAPDVTLLAFVLRDRLAIAIMHGR
jgi:hypothetical protein